MHGPLNVKSSSHYLPYKKRTVVLGNSKFQLL